MPFSLLLLISISFIFLQPTSASSLNLNNRQASWDEFVKKIEGKRMDTKLFWQTREFYSPGHFVYKKEGLSRVLQEQLLKEVGMTNLKLDNQVIFLEYNAPSFASIESLVPATSAAAIQRSINDFAEKNKVVKGKNFIIIKTQPDKAIMIFLANYNEMKKANGFFKYEEDDKDLVKGKSWLDISTIILD